MVSTTSIAKQCREWVSRIACTMLTTTCFRKKVNEDAPRWWISVTPALSLGQRWQRKPPDHPRQHRRSTEGGRVSQCLTSIDKNLIVDPKRLAREARSFGTGYEARDFDLDPVGLSLPLYSGSIFDRKDWPELMAMQDKNLSSPLDWHLDGVKIYDQRNTNFCWCFGTVAGVAAQYAKSGIDVLEFSPASTACLVKKFQNVGGWGSQEPAN